LGSARKIFFNGTAINPGGRRMTATMKVFKAYWIDA
jgi:hypothetical protein